MRVAILAAVILLCACTAEGLKSAPPAGVDFSGRWQLNVADSDDPMHLVQIANAQASAAAERAESAAQAGRGAQGPGYQAVPPAMPSIAALAEGLRFPGKQLDIKQVGGVLTFTSDGRTRICQPGGERKGARHHASRKDDPNAPLPSEREAPPPTCGWAEKTLIVSSRDVDEDRPAFEEHYSISEDGRRLVEEVNFRGGRSNGFTMSRVWDKVPQ